MIKNSVLGVIGETPMLRFTAKDFEMPEDSQLFVKLEYFNPGGSIKDRLGKYLIENGLKTGIINEHSVLIEPTAGNTGIGVALAAAQYGIRTIFVVPDQFSEEKQILMKALGAEIVNTPREAGILGAVKKAQELVKTITNAHSFNQFENFDNPDSYRPLADEILSDLTAVNLTSFVSGVGSGGTLTGVASELVKKYPELRICPVEPEGSILNGGKSGAHEIEGIGVERIPPFFDKINISEIYTISDDEGFGFAQQLAKKGLLVGSSSGAAFAAALREINSLPNGHSVLTIFPDGSDRYLSKGIYEERG